MFDALEGAPDIDKRPNLYAPLKNNLESVFVKSIDAETLLENEDTQNNDDIR